MKKFDYLSYSRSNLDGKFSDEITRGECESLNMIANNLGLNSFEDDGAIYFKSGCLTLYATTSYALACAWLMGYASKS